MRKKKQSPVCKHGQHDLCRTVSGTAPTWCTCPCHAAISGRRVGVLYEVTQRDGTTVRVTVPDKEPS